jgi:hypothetical protein
VCRERSPRREEYRDNYRERSRSRDREYRGRGGDEDRKYYDDRYRERERREPDRERERWEQGDADATRVAGRRAPPRTRASRRRGRGRTPGRGRSGPSGSGSADRQQGLACVQSAVIFSTKEFPSKNFHSPKSSSSFLKAALFMEACVETHLHKMLIKKRMKRYGDYKFHGKYLDVFMKSV